MTSGTHLTGNEGNSPRICVATSISNFDIDGTLVGNCRQIGELIAGREAEVTVAFGQCYERLCGELGFEAALLGRSPESLAIRLKDILAQPWGDSVRREAVASHQQGVPILTIAAAATAAHQAMTRILRDRVDGDFEMFDRLCNAAHRLALVEIDILTDAIHIERAGEARRETATRAGAFHGTIGSEVESLSTRSRDLKEKAAGAAKATRSMLARSVQIAAAADQSATTMRRSADTAAGLVDLIEEARSEVETASAIADQAAQQADDAVAISAELFRTAREIDSILDLIRSIAARTNLLSLNATIEAARAGDAGRGFAVVAQEVKNLASQTARATDEVAQKIAAIQRATDETVETTAAIRATVIEVRDTARRIGSVSALQAQSVVAIAGAVDETAMAASEMSSAIEEIKFHTETVAAGIDELEQGFGIVDQTVSALGEASTRYVELI